MHTFQSFVNSGLPYAEAGQNTLRKRHRLIAVYQAERPY
jgi:hypothetical protein